MKAPFSIALLAIACCTPVFVCATESTRATDAGKITLEDVPGGTIEDRL